MKVYKEKASLFSCMTKPMDGRIRNGFTDQINLLKQTSATKSEAGELIVQKEQCELGENMVPAKFRRLNDGEVKAVIEKIIPLLEPGSWPHSTRTMVLGRTVDDLRTKRLFKELHRVTDPIGESTEAWNPLKPDLLSLPRVSEKSRLVTYTEIWFKETLVGYIDDGEEGFPLMKELTVFLMEYYEGLDPVELSMLAQETSCLRTRQASSTRRLC